jgi:nitroimidazol reductase NimA-like FMN-containing flavoprotein (pyridoxamine 5'-phosphate oxidase superfamily)
MMALPPEAETRLETERNIWVASVRPDGRPHLAPVWFAWHVGKLYVCTEPGSVKARNISQNRRVVLALEDGTHPVICEGTAAPVLAPWSAVAEVTAKVAAIFRNKYDWDISSEEQYTQLLEVTPTKWLTW